MTDPSPPERVDPAAIEKMLQANAAYSESFPGPESKNPRLKIAVLACMDSRIALFGALGLRIGDAHIIRNAGALPTDDALRSLAISQHRLGTRAIMVIAHTDCGMLGFSDHAFRTELARSGRTPTWDVPGFTDVCDSVRRSLGVIHATPWLHTDLVRGFVFDVGTARLTEVG